MTCASGADHILLAFHQIFLFFPYTYLLGESVKVSDLLWELYFSRAVQQITTNWVAENNKNQFSHSLGDQRSEINLSAVLFFFWRLEGKTVPYLS